ncbi:TetR/AcrR family transcriptional regulator [Nocardia mexicana]|uniref:TetR family transcriptional regulator n=1 Tax=Nocardia mexicana TaxID=279262 RepID=A0A370H8X5_9NOCA|nr:TetR/AcrR family transcriptional regulator [Nocardia mexicana]RDI52690.1 TetR family transcriptional regulator [Nocardia mexicana]
MNTRERLLRSAEELIAEGGYATASVGAIAARSGLAAGALYRHFPSKAELFVEVFRGIAERELAEMESAAQRHSDFGDRLEAVIRTYATSAFDNRPLAWALVYEPVDPLVDAERLAYRRRYRDGMAELLREGIGTGAIREQNADLAAAAVVGAIAEALVGPLSPISGGTPAQDEVVAAIVDICRGSVGLAPSVDGSLTVARPDR